MITRSENQTIIAQCTPNGSGALALLRLSGPQALIIAERMSTLASGIAITQVPSHTIHYGTIQDMDNHTIDQVLFIVMHAPKTFTGEDTIEITTHNNVFIIEAIIARAIACGARLAHNGEFTQKAVLNNKIDLLQAEAINELIHANTQQALKKSLAQVEGSFSAHISSIEKTLIKLLALSQASFEFLDEENMEFNTPIINHIHATLSTIQHLHHNFNQQQQIRQGIRIAIIGSVNVGKSSLFNALIGTARAIVSPIEGTTRDVIEAGLYKQGNYWTLVDTAGLRTTHDSIEQEGIRRSFEQAQLADVILLAYDGSRMLSNQEQAVYEQLLNEHQHKAIIVVNKADLYPYTTQTLQGIAISTVTGDGLAALEKALTAKINSLLHQANAPFLLNKRHYLLLLELEKRLLEIIALLQKKQPPFELVAIHLTEALGSIAQLTGKTLSEDAMDAIFKEFCVGK